MEKIKRCGCLKMVISLSLSLCVLGGYLSGTSFAAAVQEDFPKKEVTIIVNMVAGGGRDLLCRGVAKTMSKYLGVPVVVLNVPGAGGMMGATKTYQSTPDGYTVGSSTLNDVFNQILEKTDYDIKKCICIGRATSSPGNLFVRSDSPFHSMKDLKTFGKPIRYSAFAYSTADTVATMVIANREGWTLKIIGGYPGAAPAALALIRGDVDITGMYLGTVKEHLRAGKLRPILSFGPKRLPDFPDIPTVVEIGHPDVAIFVTDTWFMTPPGVPKARINILEDALMKTLKDPEFIEWAKGASLDLAWLSGEDTTKLVYGLFEVLEKYKGDVKKYMER